MAHGIVDSFADGVRRYDPGRRQPIFMLNLPDNLLGAYVYRRGFYPAIQLFAPDVASSTGRTFAIATNSFAALQQTTSASQTAPDTFTLDVSPGRIIQPELGSAPWYRIVTQTPTSYEVTFSDAITTGLIFHISAGRVQYVGRTSSRGVPFGSLENPADGAVCDGAAVRFSGWALDNVAVVACASRRDRTARRGGARYRRRGVCVGDAPRRHRALWVAAEQRTRRMELSCWHAAMVALRSEERAAGTGDGGRFRRAGGSARVRGW